MSSILLVGTAVTRPDAVGTLFRSADDGPWTVAAGMPTNTGVQALTPHPARPGIVFMAARAGVFKSADSGATWTRLDVPSSNEEFWAVAIHPREPDVIFAGAAPVGVYRSDDLGESWRRVGSHQPFPELTDYSKAPKGLTSRLMRFSFDAMNPDLMFAACETNGLIVSTDGGRSWHDESQALIGLSDRDPKLQSAIITPNLTEGILDGHAVVATPALPGVVFYACRMGLFSSADRGKTWHDHDVGRFAPFTYCRDLRLSVDDPKTFYLALSIGARSNAGAFYRSTDACRTWSRIDTPVTAKSTIMSSNLHPVDPARLIYLTRGGQVIFSEDRGTRWRERQLPSDAGDGFCAAIL